MKIVRHFFILTAGQTIRSAHDKNADYRSGSMTTGLRMHDLCAIAWLVKPELFTLKPCFVAVETRGDYTAGTTVVDIEGKLNQPANVQVALSIDVAAFRDWVAQTLTLAP
nr:nucleoside hydrolase [Cronobacter sakazakii]